MKSPPGIARLIAIELLCATCLALPMGLLNGWWMAGLVGVLYILGLLVIPAVRRVALRLGVRIERNRQRFLWCLIDAQRGTPTLCVWMGLAYGVNHGWVKGILFGAVVVSVFYPIHVWSALRCRRSQVLPDSAQSPVPVLVEWMAGADGVVPVPPRYVTVARFSRETDDSEAWSVVLEFSEVPSSGPTKGVASFLEVEGPSEWLMSGVEFEMLAGFMVTARVRVI